MDVTPFTNSLRIAPRAVFERLATHADLPRFYVPDGSAWRTVTWKEFASQIRAVTLFLRDRGIVNGDRVAVFAPNRVEWASAALAIQAAGGVMVPVYPASTAAQAAYVLDHADARVVFVDTPGLLQKLVASEASLKTLEHVVILDDRIDLGRMGDLKSLGPKIVRWSEAMRRGEEIDAADPALFDRTLDGVSIDQPGLMLYTSGTSGNPKGVPLTHKNIAVNGLDWLVCNAPLLDEGAVDVLWLPMSHIFGLGEMCLGNTLGFATYLADPATVLTRLPEIQPTVFMSVPSHWEKLAILSGGEPGVDQIEKLRALTGGRLKFCLSGGAGLKREVKELFQAAGVLLLEGYGLTECSPTLTLNRPGAFRFDSVGQPLPSVTIKLAEDGEILAKGDNVFAGYHKDPEATREAFTEDGWFKTGDVGRFTDDGFLQIIDRKKDILVTAGGKNIPPQNIELRFRDDAVIAHVVVYGEGKKYLVAGVWLHDGIAPSETVRAQVEQKIEAVNKELASYETIKKFTILDRPLTVEGGLLTPSFKVRRKKVYEVFAAPLESLYTSAASPAATS
jgi:long-chain acyl-CoA synthetase